MTRTSILDEIRRMARTNAGVAPGREMFEKDTGVSTWEWQKFWQRFSEAVREAGCIPSEFIRAYPDIAAFKQWRKIA